MRTVSGQVTRRGRLDSLTGLRGVAAMFVVLYHCLPAWHHSMWLQGLAHYGYLGVSFFFCLSGFVMQFGWDARPTSGLEFLKKRVAKIYPMAMVGVVISVLSAYFFHDPLAGYIGGRHSISLSLLLLQSWVFWLPDVRQSWNGVSWSLSCEMFFYLCSPCLIPFVHGLIRRRVVGLLLLVFAAYLLLHLPGSAWLSDDFVYYAPIARLPEYIAGLLMGRLFILARQAPDAGVKDIAEKAFHAVCLRWFFSPPSIFLLTIVLPLTCLYQSDVTLSESCMDLVVMPGFLLLIYAVAKSDLLRHPSRFSLLRSAPMRILGEISFCLYMTHALLLGGVAVMQHYVRLNVTRLDGITLMYVLACLLFAFFCHVCIEKPMHTLILHFFRQKTDQVFNPHPSGL